MKFIETDGGRQAAGFIGTTGDCVTRALTIVTGEPYKQVYQELFDTAKAYSKEYDNPIAERIKRHGATPRRGVNKEIYDIFLRKRGWAYLNKLKNDKYVERMVEDTFDSEKMYIVQVSKHLTVVKNHTILDSYDPSKDGKRGVKGYYLKIRD